MKAGKDMMNKKINEKNRHKICKKSNKRGTQRRRARKSCSRLMRNRKKKSESVMLMFHAERDGFLLFNSISDFLNQLSSR